MKRQSQELLELLRTWGEIFGVAESSSYEICCFGGRFFSYFDFGKPNFVIGM